MFRYGKVFNYNQKKHTIDCWLMGTGGAYYDVDIISMNAGTNTGSFEFPDLKTINDTQKNAIVFSNGSQTTIPVKNLYAFENANTGNENLDDPTTSYVYAVLGMVDAAVGRQQPVCFGFIFPQNNQVLFDPNNAPKNIPSVTKDALVRMQGAFLHRHNSDVYSVVDSDGNMEWCHPNGTFIRIAETPTQEQDGTVHVDLTGANAMAESLDSNGKYTGANQNTRWDTSKKVGSDGNLNSARKVYAHMEVVTEKGTVVFQVDKVTGSINITTPDNSDSTSNQININCGGNATIISNSGNITAKTQSGDIDVVSAKDVNVTSSGSVSIVASSGVSIDTPLLSTTGNLEVGSGASGIFSTASGQVVVVQDGIIISLG